MYHDCSLLYIIYPVVGFFFSSYPCTPICSPGLPLSFPIPFTSLSHATTIWRMYLGHTIPFKGRNCLIGYLVNPLWSLETLAHAKARYGREYDYEVPACCPWFVSSLTWFLKMTCCIGRQGDVLDFMQDCRWSPFWVWSPYRGPNPPKGYIGTCRVCREPWASTTVGNTPWIPGNAQILL